MDLRPPIVVRVLLSAWVAWHLLAMAGSALRDTPLGAVRAVTRPYEQLLGVHQTWPMFGTAPRRTHVLRMSGRLDDGTEVPLPATGGEPDFGPILRFNRRNKFLRNAVSKKYLRASLVRWQCRTARAQGAPLRQVLMDRETWTTPAPTAQGGMRGTWAHEITHLETWNCKR